MRLVLATLFAALALPTQAQTALPFLEIVPTELGAAGVARPDAQTFVQNPALLGLMAADTRFTASGMPVRDWLGELSHGVSTAVAGTGLGPVTVGLGLAQGTLRGETRRLGDGTVFTPGDRYRALGLGVATTGPVRVATGLTGRAIATSDAPAWTGERYQTETLRGATLDLGLAVEADVTTLLGEPRVGPITPKVELRAGYSQTHISGQIRYSGFDASPLPRTAALGWSVRAGLDFPLGARTLRLLDAEASFQAERSLVRETDYAVALGGLSPTRALSGSGDDLTVGRRGARVVLGETLALGMGQYDGWGYDSVQTRSVELRAGGALDLLAALANRPVLDEVARHTDFRLGRVSTFVGTPDETTRTQFILVLRR